MGTSAREALLSRKGDGGLGEERTVVTGELAIEVAGGVVLGEGAQELGAVRACGWGKADTHLR